MTSCKTYLDPTLNAGHKSASSTLEVTTLPRPPARREAESKAEACLAAPHTETLTYITVVNTNNATTMSSTECRIDELAEPNNKRAIFEIPVSGDSAIVLLQFGNEFLRKILLIRLLATRYNSIVLLWTKARDVHNVLCKGRARQAPAHYVLCNGRALQAPAHYVRCNGRVPQVPAHYVLDNG